jgi:hypothetical protein
MLNLKLGRLARGILAAWLVLGLLPVSPVGPAAAEPSIAVIYPAIWYEIDGSYVLEEPGGAFISTVTNIYLERSQSPHRIPASFQLDSTGTHLNVWVDANLLMEIDKTLLGLGDDYKFVLVNQNEEYGAYFQMSCAPGETCQPDATHYRSR